MFVSKGKGCVWPFWPMGKNITKCTHTHIYIYTNPPALKFRWREREVHALLYNEIMSANKFERLYIKDFVCSCLPACLQCLPACLPACQRDCSATQILSQKKAMLFPCL